MTNLNDTNRYIQYWYLSIILIAMLLNPHNGQGFLSIPLVIVWLIITAFIFYISPKIIGKIVALNDSKFSKREILKPFLMATSITAMGLILYFTIPDSLLSRMLNVDFIPMIFQIMIIAIIVGVIWAVVKVVWALVRRS